MENIIGRLIKKFLENHIKFIDGILSIRVTAMSYVLLKEELY